MARSSAFLAAALVAALAPAIARTAPDDRTTQHGRPLPPLPETSPPAARPPAPAPSPAPAEPEDEPPPAAAPASDSLDAAGVRRAIAAFEKRSGGPLRIVQLVIFPNDIAVYSTDGPGGALVEYSYRDGSAGPPEPMDGTYLDCKKGMSPRAVDADALARIVEDAPRRAKLPGGAVLQLIVAQYPCGTAFVNVPVEKPGARAVSVQYRGDGTFVKVD